jgi:predicted nucleic acid-binding protein
MSTSLVVDASFAVKLILPNPEQTRCRELMAEWTRNEVDLYAPTLWLYEIASAFSKAVHFALLTETEGRQALQLAQALNVHLIPPDDAQVTLALDWTRQLKRAAAYDSFYLVLAETLSAPLWTADKRLVNAVGMSWVHYIGEDASSTK